MNAYISLTIFVATLAEVLVGQGGA